MDNDGQYPPFGGMGHYTTLLMDAQFNQQSGTFPNYMTPLRPQSGFGVDTSGDIEVDALGIDHEDDLQQEEEDVDPVVEDAEAVRAKASEIIMKAATSITPSWNVAEEPIPHESMGWQTWDSSRTFTGEIEFQKGLYFNNIDDLIYQLKVYSISKKKSFRVSKHNSQRYVAVCSRADSCGCTWRVAATIVDSTYGLWKIVSYAGPHIPTCVEDVMVVDNHLVTAEFISREISPFLRRDRTIGPSVIMEIINMKYDVLPSYYRAWDGKQRAIASIFGDWEQSYVQLPRLLDALVVSNPGSVVELQAIPTPDGHSAIFHRVFWAFGPSIAAFDHCRPLISIDGTHLYGKYKGVLLMAMSIDANNHILPLAFAVVESENGESWPWFMNLIRERVTQRTGLCVISDRHQGIMKAMQHPSWMPPNANHRFCIRHLASNVNTTFKNRHLKSLLKSAAYVVERDEFDHAMEAIKNCDVDAHRYLSLISPEMWSLANDGGFRYGVMTTNMSESFNGVIFESILMPNSFVKLGYNEISISAYQRFGMVASSTNFMQLRISIQKGVAFCCY